MNSPSRIAKAAGQFALLAGLFLTLPLAAQNKVAEAAWKKNSAKAEAALKKNQLNQASDLYRAAVENAEQLGAQDARLSQTLRQFAGVRLQLGETPDAEAAFRRALVLDQNRLGSNAVQVAGELIDLGDVAMNMNRFEEADEYFARAQAIVEKKYGRYDRAVGICLEGRGDAAMMDDRLPAAEKFLKDALDLAESPRYKVNFEINQYATRNKQTPNKGQLGAVLNDLGILYTKMKRYDEAENSLKKSVKMYETQYGKNSLYLCNPLVNSTGAEVALHKYPEAESNLRRCLAILKSGNSDHPMVETTQKYLDKVLALEKQPTQDAPQ